MEEERELLLCFGRAKVRKKRQRAIREEGERYIYLPAPNGHRTKGVGRDGACGLEVGRDGARDCGVGRDGAHGLEVGQDEARGLEVRRDRARGLGRDGTHVLGVERDGALKGSGVMEPMALGSGKTF